MSDYLRRDLERRVAADGGRDSVERLVREIERAGEEIPYVLLVHQRRLEEDRAREAPVGKTARVFYACGPCLTHGGRGSGVVVRETRCFYVTQQEGWATNRGALSGSRELVETRVKKNKVHLAPCVSCTDHPETWYPNGYQD